MWTVIINALKSPKVIMACVIGGLILILAMGYAYKSIRVDHLEFEVAAKDRLIKSHDAVILAQKRNIEEIKKHSDRLNTIAQNSGKIIERIETMQVVEVPQECKGENVIAIGPDFRDIYTAITERFNGVRGQDGN